MPGIFRMYQSLSVLTIYMGAVAHRAKKWILLGLSAREMHDRSDKLLVSLNPKLRIQFTDGIFGDSLPRKPSRRPRHGPRIPPQHGGLVRDSCIFSGISSDRTARPLWCVSAN